MLNDDDRRLAWQWEQMQQGVIDKAKEAYAWAVEHGIAKEQARAVLPEGNTVITSLHERYFTFMDPFYTASFRLMEHKKNT